WTGWRLQAALAAMRTDTAGRALAALGILLTIRACACKNRVAAGVILAASYISVSLYIAVEVIISQCGWLLGRAVVARHPDILTGVGLVNAVGFFATCILFWILLARCVDARRRSVLTWTLRLSGIALLLLAIFECVRQADRFALYAF